MCLAARVLELAAVALWCFLVALAGGAVGLVLGNIRLPVILLAAASPATGAAANIAISGVDLLRRGGPARDGAAGERLDVRAAVLAGLVIGFLGGVVGLILGSLRMPALLRWVGMSAQRAVGTNLAVGVLVGIAGLAGHLPNAAPDWDLLGVGAAASIPGALMGARLTGRLSEAQLVRAIGAVLLVAGAATGVEAVVG